MSSEQIGIRIFTGSTSAAFTQRMCDHLGVEMGAAQTIMFSDKNIFVRVNEQVRDKDVYIVQAIGLHPNDEFMELLFWIDAFKRSSAGSITAILPYFSYAKGDKKDEPRVSIRARVCADCLESAGVDRIIAMDLHSPQIQGFFKRPVDHLYGMGILCDYIKTLGLQDMVIVSPDVGFAKNARKYAAVLGAPIAIGDKNRSDHSENAEVLEIIGSVGGKNAVIVDDSTISCGTLVEMSKHLQKLGAKKVYACVTHALLNEKGVQALEKSCIEQLVVTDTVENGAVIGHPKIKIVSAAPLFAKAVEIIHNKASLSQLFNGN